MSSWITAIREDIHGPWAGVVVGPWSHLLVVGILLNLHCPGCPGWEDLSLDSWHSANRTWRGDLSSFGTHSSERSERSLFSDSEESVEPSEDELQELLGESGDNQNSLRALDLGGVPRDTAVVQPGQEDLESPVRERWEVYQGDQGQGRLGSRAGFMEDDWR